MSVVVMRITINSGNREFVSADRLIDFHLLFFNIWSRWEGVNKFGWIPGLNINMWYFILTAVSIYCIDANKKHTLKKPPGL